MAILYCHRYFFIRCSICIWFDYKGDSVVSALTYNVNDSGNFSAFYGSTPVRLPLSRAKKR